MGQLDLSDLRTAGAYIQRREEYLFAIGPDGTQTHNGLVRIGGHIEANESCHQSVIREAQEEARVELKLVDSLTTFYFDGDKGRLTEVDCEWTDQLRPLLLSGGTAARPQSVMFRATTNSTPVPDSETFCLCEISRGTLLLLGNSGRPVGYGDLRAFPKGKLNLSLPLVARAQFLCLVRILAGGPGMHSLTSRRP